MLEWLSVDDRAWSSLDQATHFDAMLSWLLFSNLVRLLVLYPDRVAVTSYNSRLPCSFSNPVRAENRREHALLFCMMSACDDLLPVN